MTTALLTSASADVMLPPTLVFDFLYLGWPLGLAAGVAIVAGAIAAYRRARARRRGRAFSGLMAALVVAGMNLASYVVWASFLRESPRERRFHDAPPAPSAVTSGATP